MGKKKPSRQPKVKNRQNPATELHNADVDQRSTNALHALIKNLERDVDPLAESPAAQAQDLAFQAFEIDEPTHRIQLARQSIQIWPDCADGYLVLGFEAGDEEERLKFFEDAVAAGRRAIGKQDFRQFTGHFWSVLETRPYMRALMELSNTQWILGRHDESIERLREMLQLNPNDNQGARYVLLSHLLFLKNDEAANTLIEQYADDPAADWKYSRALLKYRQEGDTPAAKKTLQAAKKLNKYVPAYLVGNEQLPESPPDFVAIGERSEAQSYCGEALRHWRETPGAVPWLRETLKIRRPKVPQTEINKRDWVRRKAKLLGLPQDEADIWHVSIETVVDSLPPEFDVQSGTSAAPSESKTVWGFVVTSPVREMVVSGEFSDEKPTISSALSWLVGTMLQPDDDDPRRPGLVRVSERAFAEAWRSQLSEIDIDCEFVESLDDVQDYLRTLRQETERQMSARGGQILADDRLVELPQVDEEWQLDVRLLAAFVGDRGTPQRPWTILIGDRTNQYVIAQDLITGSPPAGWLVKVVRRGMSAPGIGPSRRPAVIQVATVEQRNELEGWLSKLRIRCVLSENLDFLDSLYADITQHLAGDGAPAGILTTPGVCPEQVAGAFDAASEFYRVMPWRDCPSDAPIKIESTEFQSGPWYAMVMGQGGMLQGIALYDDRKFLEKMLLGKMTEVESRRKNSALAVYFGEVFDIPPADLHDLERLGWQVAGPEAYPTFLRVNPGMNVRRPLAWELKLLEASMRAVMDYIKRNKSEPVDYNIPTSVGHVPLTLAWSG